jgi:hypothetical protein
VTSCTSTHDGLHPNALGEYQLAHAFSKTLHGTYNIGRNVLQVPETAPPRSCPIPSNFQVVAAPSGNIATWDHVFGAYGYNALHRLKGVEEWEGSLFSIQENRLDTTTKAGVDWEYKVQAYCGDGVLSDFTEIISITSAAETAPGPLNIYTQATFDGINIYWNPPPGYKVKLYEVSIHDQDEPGAAVTRFATKDNHIHIGYLNHGHRYVNSVATWTDLGGGVANSGNAVTIGYGMPNPPTKLGVATLAQGDYVQLQFDGTFAAAGYRVWKRSINGPTDAYEPELFGALSTCRYSSYLLGGAWNYVFCASSYNGNLESAKSVCIPGPDEITDDQGCPVIDPRPSYFDMRNPGGVQLEQGTNSTNSSAACIVGFGDNEYAGLCRFACSYNQWYVLTIKS